METRRSAFSPSFSGEARHGTYLGRRNATDSTLHLQIRRHGNEGDRRKGEDDVNDAACDGEGEQRRLRWRVEAEEADVEGDSCRGTL